MSIQGHPPPMDWGKFEDTMKRMFTNPGFAYNPTWIEKMVHSSLSKAMTGFPGVNQMGKWELFETHRNVVVKFHSVDRSTLDRIKLLISSRNMIVEGPGEGEKETITLLAPINTKTARAAYKDGILQVHARKMAIADNYRELFIDF